MPFSAFYCCGCNLHQYLNFHVFPHVSQMYFNSVNCTFLLSLFSFQYRFFSGALLDVYFTMKVAGVMFIIAMVNSWPLALSDSPVQPSNI